LPIISEGKIKGVHLYDNFKKNIKKINNDFIVFAGGKGTRLLPLTSNLPKPMIRIKNKPILEHLINKAKNEGFYKFIIIVQHLKEKIINYFKDGKKFGVKIKYIIEDKPLGTAGGLSLIKGKVSDNFIICNSDIISDLNFQSLLNFHGKNSIATVAVKVLDSKENYGLVKIKNDKITSFNEKPITKKYINTGVYVFNKSSIKYLKKNQKIDMISFLKNLNNKKKIIKAFPIYENWQDLGIKKKIRKYL
jgi:NDP-sugar pyrophosphorylase family protein